MALSGALHAWVILDVDVSRPTGAVRGSSAVLTATLRLNAEPPAPAARPSDAPGRNHAKPPPASASVRATRRVRASPEAPPPSVVPDPAGPGPEPLAAPVAEAAVPEAGALATPGAPTEATGPAVPIPLLEDPEFYPARLLDVLPRPLAEVVLQYPDEAADAEVSGRVVLLLMIDELGVVVEASVIEAEPPGHFEEAAIESFRDVLFQPAQRNGRAVKSRLPVEVTFEARTDSAKP